jgi:hypothetical protein
MVRRCLRSVALAALPFTFLVASSAGLAFETVDTLPYPSAGAFPAWPGDPIPPWTVFAYGGMMYDSNAFRRSTGEQSDMVARLGAGGRMLQRIYGRQRLLLEGFGEYYDFNRFSEIDHFGYGVRADWLWELGNDVDGAVGYTRRRRHADLGEFQSETRVMTTTDRVVVDGGYRFAANWRIFAGAEHVSSKRNTALAPDLELNTARASLTYGTPLGNRIGAEFRGTKGDARVVDSVTETVFVDDFDERELAATVIYGLTGQIRVNGRAGRTERDYAALTGRNFSGTTYDGVLEWLPSQKLIFSFNAYRRLESVIDIDASHVLREGVAFGTSWAPTFKLVFTARFINEQRLYEGDPGAALTGVAARDETLRIWRFGAGWEPRRHWQVGAGFDLGERESNQLGREYDYTQVMLNVRWTY